MQIVYDNATFTEKPATALGHQQTDVNDCVFVLMV